MSKVYPNVPKAVKEISTPFRKIQTQFPVPNSVSILEKLKKFEPRSMQGQPLIIWDRAEGVNVYDKWGNKWLDWSSGVLVANVGHSNPAIKKAIVDQVNHGLLHNYCFPSEIRAELVEKLAQIAPADLNKVFLLTTGSETTECAIKLSRTYGERKFGREKISIISFTGAFHGRTLGAQMIGGIPVLKEWIVNLDPAIHQAPFPDCFRCPWGKENYAQCEEECFENFKKYLDERSITPAQICGIISETYQGGGATFAPPKFIQLLARFCQENNILLIFDEVQAAFGRTGKMFAFEHYEVVPDLICCGKGITSSLPLSAIIGREEIMDLYGPREMTSTHTGNPVCVAAALANLDYLIENNLVEHAAKVGPVLKEELKKIKTEFPTVVGEVQGEGLVYGVHIVKPGTKEPDGEVAFEIVGKAVEKGLALFAPVGLGGATIKIAPPLVITEEAVKDGAQALKEAITEVVGR